MVCRKREVKERNDLYYDRKDKKDADRHIKAAQRLSYDEMEKTKPRKSAIAAFRHKPYGMGGVHSELGRQGIEKA